MAVEAVIWRAAPGRLSDDRREALRLRIFSQLGAQDAGAESWRSPFRTRWIAIPAGAGIAATIIATIQYADRTPNQDGGASQALAQADGQLLVDGLVRGTLSPGQTAEALTHAWLSFGDSVRIGLEPGSTVRYESSGTSLELRLLSGSITAASTAQAVSLSGNGWSATVAAGSVGRIGILRGSTIIEAMEGEVSVTVGADSYVVTPANSPLYIAGPHPPDATGEGIASPGSEWVPVEAPPPAAPSPPASTEARQTPGSVEPDPPRGVAAQPPFVGHGALPPPANDELPPANNAGGNGQGTPPVAPGSNSAGNAAGNGIGNGAANSNAGGGGNGAANANAGASGNSAPKISAGGGGNGAPNANPNRNGAANGEGPPK